MSVAPHAGIIDFGTFTPPTLTLDGIQGEVPQPLIGQENYVLTGNGWSSLADIGGLSYQGTWNAATNTPTLVSSVGTQGYYYVVSVAGTTNLNGITSWAVGDWAVFNGSAWQRIQASSTFGTMAYQNSDSVNITGGTITGLTALGSDYLQLNTSATPSIALGKLRWNQTTATMAFGIVDGTDEVNIGEQMFAYVTNAESVAITRGQAVYLYQATGNRASVKLASNLGDPTSAKTLGLVAQDSIGANQTGFVITQGQLSKVDTSAYAEGATLYLGATAGTLTTTKPQAPNHLVYIGVVERSNAGNGQIYVRPQNGYELDEIHDVLITPPVTTGQTLVYDGSVSLWKNSNAVVMNGGSVDNSPIGATTASTGKFTSVTTPSVTASSTDLTLSAISTGVVNLNTLAGKAFSVTDHPYTAGGANVNFTRAFGGQAGYTTGLMAQGSDTNVTMAFSAKGASGIEFWTANLGEKQFVVSRTASAVNYVQVTGAATTLAPVISAQGSDANIQLQIQSKGTGLVRFATGSGLQAYISDTASPVNQLVLTGGATTFAPKLSVAGTDTNISMAFQPKGTGAIDLAAGSSGVNISNGGTVTAITRTNAGASYTSKPSVAITAPTTAGGVTALASVNQMYVSGATIAGGGTGYTVNDVLTVVGGTQTGVATLTVSTVSAGVITAVTISSAGAYSVLPTSPVSVTGGTGTGATFNLTWSIISFNIDNAGSGYIEQPQVTFSGGGGSGASAYATVGGTTQIKSLGNTLNFLTSNTGIGLQVKDSGGGQGASGGYWTFAQNYSSNGVMYASSTGNISSGGATNLNFQTNTTAQTQMVVSHTASAVNYVQVTGAATGNRPSITAQGSDTNAGLSLYGKGTGGVYIGSNLGTTAAIIATPTTGTNYFAVNGSATTIAPTIAVAGGDTNIPLAFITKGTGAIDLAAGSSGVNISNGGTVTAITRTNGGSGYTSNPSIAISAPTTAGGVQAVLAVDCGPNLPTITSGGTGYTVGDVLTFVGGTFTTAYKMNVTSVSGGVITGISPNTFGSYTVFPASPVSVTGGTGTGATFTATNYSINTPTITNAGSGYIEQPTITFSGGGGSGASAYATVGSATKITSLAGSGANSQSLSFYTPSGEQVRIQDAGATPLCRLDLQGGNNYALVQSNSSTASILILNATGVGTQTINLRTGNTTQSTIAHTASAVNYLQLTGSSTNNRPAFTSQGSDTNIGMNIYTKGGGELVLGGNGREVFVVTPSTSAAANFLQVANAASTGSPIIKASPFSVDTNVDITFTPKGIGQVKVTNSSQSILNVNSTGSYAGLLLNAATGNNPYIFGYINNAEVGRVAWNSSNGMQFFTSSAATEQFRITDTASAVNYLSVTGGVTSGSPVISSQGSDANIELAFKTKGNWNHLFKDSGNSNGFLIDQTGANTGVATNYITVTRGPTTVAPSVQARGTDTNISLVAQPKGTGAFDIAAGSSGVNISNGGTVTALTRTGTGALYTSFPSIAISAPTTAGGVTATASMFKMGASSATIAAGGTGYTVGDTLTISGGTPTASNATYTVATVSAGVVTSVNPLNFAEYTVLPTNPVTTTGGTGTGCTLNVTYFVPTGSWNITNAGSGYVEQPTVTFSGGGASSQATAYASIGALTTIKALGETSGSFLAFRGPNNITDTLRLGTGNALSAEYVTIENTQYSRSNIFALGSANSQLWIGANGSGYVNFCTRGTSLITQFRIADTTSAVNYLQATGSATGTAVQLLAAGSDTNISVAVQPKGTGALQAQKTDSTVTGGNARGANAVDWQTARGAATGVASGQYAVTSGGYGNTASAFTTTVGGGYANNASGYSATIAGGTVNQNSSAHSAICGGTSNTASGWYSFIGGGNANVSGGYYNIISGGQGNSGTANAAVTTQAGTANGTTTLTLSASNASIKIGQYISGTYINTNTYVAAISGTTLTLSQAASGSGATTLTFNTPHGVVVGGGNNTATGSYSFIGGGGDAGTAANRNVASGDWSFVGGGAKNVASGVGAFIGGGGINTVSTFLGNTASNVGSFVGGGFGHNSANVGSVIAGGTFNSALGSHGAILGGRYGTDRGLVGLVAFPACVNPIASTSGISQAGLLVLGVQTTDATATVLRSDANAASTINQIILPNNSAYYFRGELVAGVTGGGDTKGWFIEGVIKRGANAASTALVGTPTVTSNYGDAGASTWTVTATADTTNGGLAITVTGQAATTIRWVAQIRTTEMTY